MAHGLAPSIHIALVDGRAVVLDTRADRYSIVGERAASALREIAADGVAHDRVIIEALIRGGILLENGGSAIMPNQPIPLSSALDRSLGDATRLSIGKVGLAVSCAIASLRLRGLERTLAAFVRRKGTSNLANCGHEIARFARGFAKTRPSVPISRLCLRDSLALSGMLIGSGFKCELVIGVRLNPFGAHSWVQAGGMVLSDPVDTIRPLTPILIL